MDTPEKTQIGNPLSKFEDSPVFNYINSLSPIKPVKSIHITQSFNSITFTSPPSVFTSPHVISHKESRFLRRHNCPDLPKPDFSSDNGKKICTSEVIVDAARLYDNSADLLENFKPVVSIGGPSVEQSTEHSKLSIELPRASKYDCASADSDPTPRCGTETDSVSELAGSSASHVPLVQGASEKGSSECESGLENMCQTEQPNEGTGCDWESLISEAADLLIFNSPGDTNAFKGLMGRPMDHGTIFHTSLVSHYAQDGTSNAHKMQLVDPVGFSEQQVEDPSSLVGEITELNDINQCSRDNDIDQSMTCDTDVNDDNQNDPSLHRGMRRRCLDFETIAAHWKKLGDCSNSSSSLLSESDEIVNSKDKYLKSAKPGNDSWRILPGIGLHLNAFAITSKENNSIKHEILPSGSQQLRLPGSAASFQSPTTVQQPVDEPLTSASTEREIVPSENGAQPTEDGSVATCYLVCEEFNHISPRKKRRRTENAGESDACKRCNCKKSKCLKLYCECFAAGVYCIEPCSCQECFNKPIHEDTVLATRKQIESRNPLAFAPKVIRSSESIPEIGDDSNKTPASARHKRGCNCKKSNCLKKYCECYQGGVGCSINCRCEGCKNAFGRKDSSALGAEAEPEEEDEEEEEETEASEKKGLDKTLQVAEIQNHEQQNPSTLPTTPLQLSRPLLQLPFSSKNKPPPSLIVSGSTSQSLASSRRYGKPNILRSQPKMEKHCQNIQEDEIPEILRGNCSPSTGIKTASPNKKRVTPPYRDLGSSSSPGLRSGRKLILQSIPSFPSLTPQQ